MCEPAISDITLQSLSKDPDSNPLGLMQNAYSPSTRNAVSDDLNKERLEASKTYG